MTLLMIFSFKILFLTVRIIIGCQHAFYIVIIEKMQTDGQFLVMKLETSNYIGLGILTPILPIIVFRGKVL
jgi:hypothetical protein